MRHQRRSIQTSRRDQLPDLILLVQRSRVCGNDTLFTLEKWIQREIARLPRTLVREKNRRPPLAEQIETLAQQPRPTYGVEHRVRSDSVTQTHHLGVRRLAVV